MGAVLRDTVAYAENLENNQKTGFWTDSQNADCDIDIETYDDNNMDEFDE